MPFYEPLKTGQPQSVSCVIAGQSEQDIDSPRNATSGNVTTQLVLLPNLLSKPLQNVWLNWVPKETKEGKDLARRQIHCISRSIVDRMAGWTSCTYLRTSGWAQENTKKRSNLMALATAFQNKSYLTIFGTFLVWGQVWYYNCCYRIFKEIM